MKDMLKITIPSDIDGFIEYKRSFVVEGIIKTNSKLPNNAVLNINIYKDNKIVRNVCSKSKNAKTYIFHKDLTTYKDLDKSRKGISEFGFPELIVEDLIAYKKTINKGNIKCWYNDTTFKAIIISASNIKNGAIFDDGMNFVDENNKPYKLLKMGEYKIVVTLTYDNKTIKTSKKIIIGKRKNQIIARFNPLIHKDRMIKWCKENGYSIIKDKLPGYLDPYMGKWYYHMGLLKMYRANDICLFDNVCTRMFVYLIDKTSTSYATELAYLQNNDLINDKKFKAYYYDIGEAILNKTHKKAVIKQFKASQTHALCRVDLINDKTSENVFNLNEEGIVKSYFDLNSIEINSNNNIAIMGVIKPSKIDAKYFILKNDNTYRILNEPSYIIYKVKVEDKEYLYKRYTNMERIDKESIGKSIYEFYNIINIKKAWSNKTILISISGYDKMHNELFNDENAIKIKVK